MLRPVLPVATLALAAPAVFAGSLDPPAAPQPTPGPEPRTPISSLPVSIEAPGSYYLTASLTGVTGSSGIEISSDAVTIDLGGFSIIGVPGAGSGIVVEGTRNGLAVRNGTLRSWPGGGLVGTGAQGSQLADLRVTGCSTAGLLVGNNNTVESCVALSNTAPGITVGTGTTVIGCVSRGNSLGIDAGPGCVIVDCAVEANFTAGIRAAQRATVLRCSVSNSNSDGINAGQGSTVADCTVAGIVFDGIEVSTDCQVRNNTVDGAGSGGTGNAGILVTGNDCRIDGNAVTDSDIGIQVTGTGNLIVRNSASGNTPNFDIAADNSTGTVFNVAGVGLGSANAWANFEF